MPLMRDGDITTGWIRKKRPFLSLFFGDEKNSVGTSKMRIPKLVYNYAKRISELTGLPLQIVLRSRPVQNLMRKLQEYVEVEA